MSSSSGQARLSNTPINTLEKLDEEIAELETRLLSLKLTRNEFAPVARLHPEILQEIFFLAHHFSYPKGKMSLTMTWVCHRWRELAQRTSSLWSYIDFKNREWVETAISRTKNRELEFNFHQFRYAGGPTGPSLSLIRSCLENLSRIRSLRMNTYTGGGQDKSVSTLLDAPEWLVPAPALRKLDLEDLCLPPHAFSGIYPSLQSLSLANCSVDWDTFPVISGLKELVITNPATLISLERMIEILEVVQQDVEEIRIRRVIMDITDPGNLPSQRIQLTKLERCEIDEDNPPVIAQLLSCISFPRQCQVNVCAFDCPWEEYDMITELVASRNIKQWPVHYIQIDVEACSFTLHVSECWEKATEDEDEDHETFNSIQLDFGFEGRLLAIPVFNLLPIHPMKHVCIRNYHGQDLQTFTYIGDLGTVEELTIQSASTGEFLRYVQDRIGKLNFGVPDNFDESGKQAMARTALSFSNLQTLTISGCEMTKGYFIKCEDLLLLYNWLKGRIEHGMPLWKLLLREMPRQEVTQMKDMFLDVVRDGIQMDKVVDRQS